jgi:ferredoxin
MRVVVDLARCQGYGQCEFLAPSVFSMPGEEALHYDLEPDDSERVRVLRAARPAVTAGQAPRGQPAIQERSNDATSMTNR